MNLLRDFIVYLVLFPELLNVFLVSHLSIPLSVGLLHAAKLNTLLRIPLRQPIQLQPQLV